MDKSQRPIVDRFGSLDHFMPICNPGPYMGGFNNSVKDCIQLLSGKMCPTVIDKSSSIEAIESSPVIKNTYF